MPDRADLVLDSAAGLVAERGRAFTMSELAEAAGIGRATLYRDFASKKAVIERLGRERGLLIPEAQDARARIFAATRRLIGQHGLTAITVEQIAAAAEVGPVTIYRQFGDKDGLLQACLRENGPRGFILPALRDLDTPPREALIDVATHGIAFFAENPGLVTHILFATGDERSYIQRLRRSDETGTRMLTRYFARQIARGQLEGDDPRTLAVSFRGLLISGALMSDRLMPRGKFNARRIAERLVDQFLAGALPRRARSAGRHRSARRKGAGR